MPGQHVAVIGVDVKKKKKSFFHIATSVATFDVVVLSIHNFTTLDICKKKKFNKYLWLIIERPSCTKKFWTSELHEMQEIPKQSEPTVKEVFRRSGCLTLCQVVCY